MNAPVLLEDVHKVFFAVERDPGLGGALRALLARRTREVRAADGLTLSVRPGEVVALLGPNGAGKTTTLKMIAGLLHVTRGVVRTLGFDPTARRPEMQKRFALVMGHRNQLWWELPVQETFLLQKEIYEIPAAAYASRRDELCALLEIEPLLAMQVKKLSAGQRRKCELALSLLHGPELLLLDEPTIGLDVAMKRKVRAFFAAYAREKQATVIITSHDMDDVAALAERVLILDRGKLVLDASLAEAIARFSPEKRIAVDLLAPAPRAEVEGLGTLVELGPTRLVLDVPRAEVPARAAALLARLQVEDLTIEEPPIDDVIRRIFAEGAGR